MRQTPTSHPSTAIEPRHVFPHGQTASGGKKPTDLDLRPQANIKLEAYGFAIADASKAIDLDPNYVKVAPSPLWEEERQSLTHRSPLMPDQAYYRRAMANTAILHAREALRDFKTVVKKVPTDKDAKLKLAECEKIVRRVEFLKAIEVADPPSAAEGLDLDSMAVDESYDGARLGTEMTTEFIEDMIQRFKNGKKIHRKYVFQIILAVKNIVYQEPTMVETEVKPDTKLTVCGDTHGGSPNGSPCPRLAKTDHPHQANSSTSWRSSD